jgi:hypothetical protein
MGVEMKRSAKDRPAAEPGGCECTRCGVIFIGAEWHELCGICDAETAPSDTTEPQRCPSTGELFGD